MKNREKIIFVALILISAITLSGSSLHGGFNSFGYFVKSNEINFLLEVNNSAVTFNIPESQDTFCIIAGVQNISGGLPIGGVYSGPGVTDLGNGINFDFDPTSAGFGSITITYSYDDGAGCTGIETDQIEVILPIPVTLNIPDNNDTLCIEEGIVTNISGGSPLGGIYSGSGVIDNSNGLNFNFDPSLSGTGLHLVTYQYQEIETGCSG